MSKRQIISALKRKGLEASECDFFYAPSRGGSVPTWNVTLSNQSYEKCCAILGDIDPNFMGMNAVEVLEWIGSLPTINAALNKGGA